MNKNQAVSLIENTLGSRFDRNQFKTFINNLLNDVEPKRNQYSGQFIWDDYKGHINSYERIGKYIDPNNNKLDILIVKVKSVTKLERARTTLRNFVIKHLNKFDKDYALVAFYSEEDEGADWRFSFIKLEYQSYFDEEKEEVRIEKHFTPAKRYSFLVGENEQSHTAKTQILPILQDISNNPTVEEIENSFSIEKVTSEFFNQYKDLYIKLFEHFKEDRNIITQLNKANIDNARFTKKLLGQIVFLYFLQKKGWLGVPKDERWGKGQKRFIQGLFKKSKEQNQNFFRDNLQYLFYEALAEERNNNDSYYERFNCRIPFLNGGLFEAEYNWKNANITIPENLFRNDEKNKAGDVGTGILDIFDRYNFTIKEDEPLDKEVAVDPEMLGKVFENMLEITERKSKGAFYTPREIVHYMCQESLINYLNNALEGEVEKIDIETYIRKGHNALENDQRVAKKGTETETYKYKLPKSIRKNADLIDQKLTKIRICDPAIGSGAFPVGLLHELVNAKLVIKPHFSENYLADKLEEFGLKKDKNISENNYIYRLKRHIIQESIYGVDIDASAIDIARLRLWLSLVVDEDDLDTIETLPNLDYKIVCGNSLISRYNLNMPIDNVFKEFNKKVKDKDYNNQNIKNLVGDKDIDLAFYKRLTNDFLLESSQDKKALFRELISEIKNAFKASFNKKEKEKISKVRGTVENLQQSDIFSKQVGTKTQIKQAKKRLAKLEKEKQEIEEGVLFKNATEWRFEFPNLLDDNGDFIGFDIVIGNPPYIRQESIKEFKLQFQQAFSVFVGTADIYTYFYEKGVQLLNDNGHLCYITSNKWMRAKYGEKLRGFFKHQTQLKQIIDFEGQQVFENATVDTNILLCGKTANTQPDFAYQKKLPDENNPLFNMVIGDLSANAYTLQAPEILALKKKIEQIGTPLKDWDIRINYGIKTGFNEAFIINTAKRDELIAADPKSAEIIKPILRGRDIKAYQHHWAGLWVILAKYQSNQYLEQEYPIIYNHLKQYKEKLKQRGQCRYGGKGNQGQHHWLELDNNPSDTYLAEFAKEKIVYSEIVKKPQFYFDVENYYAEATSFIMTGESIKFLMAFLHSKLITYVFKLFYAGGGLGETGYRYKKAFFEQLPIPQISKPAQQPFIALVNKILTAKQQAQDTRTLETQIDKMVYGLYSLTDDEIRIVEKKV